MASEKSCGRQGEHPPVLQFRNKLLGHTGDKMRNNNGGEKRMGRLSGKRKANPVQGPAENSFLAAAIAQHPQRETAWEYLRAIPIDSRNRLL